MTFNQEYKTIKELCSGELLKIEKIILEKIEVRDELQPYIKNFLTMPSKRIRPVLSILYLKALGQSLTEKQLQILAAVELVHNASLIHDDIIDNSELRRGEKTISYEFGNKLGVICGDYLLSIAMDIISEFNNNLILKYFTDTLNNMCQGEINQHFDRYKIGTIEDYIEKIKNKTGYLFELVMKSPLLFSNTTSENILKASEFGLNFGIAFQIRDDILNLTTANKNSDKPSKNDIDDGIYTASVIYAGSTKKYPEGVEKARCLLNNYIAQSKKDIESFEKNIYTEAIIKLLELLNHE